MKKILYVGSECMPFAATGGLGDVLGSLPLAIKAYYGENVDVRVAMPLYGSIGEQYRSEMKTEAVFTVPLGWRQQYCGVLSLERHNVTYYFIDNEYYFKRDNAYGYNDDGERFAFFSLATVMMLSEIDFVPDIMHLNDWQSAACTAYLKYNYENNEAYQGIKTIFTIHNIEYQGVFPMEKLNETFSLPWKSAVTMEHLGALNLMKSAVVLADRVTTVSETYAEEIKTSEFGRGLEGVLSENADKLSGILNGIDPDFYNPQTDSVIEKNYSAKSITNKEIDKTAIQRELGLPETDAPLFAIISRLAGHKGIDLVRAIAHVLLFSENCQLVVLGTGEFEYECFFRWLEEAFPNKMKACITYNRDLSRRLYAGADFILMPSKSEPCGLTQMIASRYGAVPIVRETGGLYDTIKNYSAKGSRAEGNGFTFVEYTSEALFECIGRALKLYGEKTKFESLRKKVMKIDFSFARQAEKYAEMYDNI